MGSIATIRIKHSDGFATINASDFDPAVHERYTEPTAGAAPATATASASRAVAPEPFGLAEMNADSAKALVATVTAAEQLDAIVAEETAGKARKSVLAAVEARRLELEG